jgi:hypothetical protein
MVFDSYLSVSYWMAVAVYKGGISEVKKSETGHKRKDLVRVPCFPFPLLAYSAWRLLGLHSQGHQDLCRESRNTW